MKGYLCLVLHAHLPFVRHPEEEYFLEENWLYEAITETYIPLIQVFEGLVRDGVDFRLTMSLTPTLCSMLEDPLLQEMGEYSPHIWKDLLPLPARIAALSTATLKRELKASLTLSFLSLATTRVGMSRQYIVVISAITASPPVF